MNEDPDDGLTEHERAYLTTPVSQMAPEDRMAGLAIKEKKANYIHAQNEELRKQDEAERKVKKEREIEENKRELAAKREELSGTAA